MEGVGGSPGERQKAERVQREMKLTETENFF